MKRYVIVGILAVLIYKWIETNPFAQIINTSAQSSVAQSQAQLQYAQAAQIEQQIRRQNEFDDGTAMNVNARIVSGHGITDFEQVASPFVAILSGIVIGLAMLAGAGILIVLIKLTTSSTTEV